MSSVVRRSQWTRTRWVLVASVAAALIAGQAASAHAQTGPDLGELSLEELLNVEVTSVSRRRERLIDSAAAVHVITGEDLRRSGYRTIPDALRMVPGLHVGQIDSNKWSVSVRGFGGRFSNKLLVLVDGRSVYTPLFGGVLWNVVNVPMDEIDRIEIIRGPGATMWGANAVNGVINIITRPVFGATGARVSIGTGSEDRSVAAVRVGHQFSDRTAFRVDGSFADRDGSAGPVAEMDSARWGRLGGRLDSRLSDRHDLLIQAAWQGARVNEMVSSPKLLPPFFDDLSYRTTYDASFASVQWTARAAGGETTSQLSLDHLTVAEPLLETTMMTWQAGVQHARSVGVHHIVAGTEIRRLSDDALNNGPVVFSPASRVLSQWSVFAQDDMAVVRDTVHLTVGAKVEDHTYMDVGFQPTVRATWRPGAAHMVWSGASRALRVPSRAEVDGILSLTVLPPSAEAPLPQLLTMQRDSGRVLPETVTSVEGGYRWQAGTALSLDVAVYRNRYEQLLQVDRLGVPTVTMSPVPHVVVPVLFANTANASIKGLEVSLTARPTGRTLFSTGYSANHGVLEETGASTAGPRGDYPKHMWFGRASFTLPSGFEVDAMGRAIGHMARTGVSAYGDLDLRIGYRLGGIDISVHGRNLIGGQHVEFLPDVIGTRSGLTERQVSLHASWTF